MKYKLLSIFALVFCFFAQGETTNFGNSGPVKKTKGNGTLTITFNFMRGGRASSQYAIWIEDMSGNVVKTVYATGFTAKGGYSFRETSLPVWVNKSGLKSKSKAEADAVSGATPGSGDVQYTWTGTDNRGKLLPKGEYRFFVEGTSYWHDRHLYSGTVNMGSKEAGELKVKTESEISDGRNKNMIRSLKANYTPKGK